MRILITSSRAPVALELIRVLAQAGHTVYASDTFAATVGSASRYLRRHLLTPPPRRAPAAFGRCLLELVQRYRIDWLIPTCEEVFYVGMFHHLLAPVTRVLCEPLTVLRDWHHKYAFQQRVTQVGLATPATTLVSSQAELAAVLARTPRYLLKPAYSRFATRILTNYGPRAGKTPLTECRPTAAQPWLVQEYIEGDSVCSYSVVHRGRITAHCAYRTPHSVSGGAGTSFLSVDGAETLAIVQQLATSGEQDFTGQLSFDYLRGTDGRLRLLECNPRATSAVHLLAPDRLAEALLNPDASTWVEPAGRYQQLLLVVLAQSPVRLWRQPPHAWLKDVILNLRDPLPALMQVLQVLHFLQISCRQQIGVLEATTDDIEWNGPAALLASPPATV
jgi:predicted ATP-grasp superfamily ATP-dependent carboligase